MTIRVCYKNNVNILWTQHFFCLKDFKVYLDRTYFIEIKNWKYCSIIIFKCVNSTVEPILIKKLLKSKICEIYEQCMSALYTIELVKSCRLKKKKWINALKSHMWTQTFIQTLPLHRCRLDWAFAFFSLRFQIFFSLHCSQHCSRTKKY